MRKLLLLLTLAFLASTSLKAQMPASAVRGQIAAQTTNAACVGGVNNGGAVDQPLNGLTNAVGISATGTWAATLNIQTSVDHGLTWTAQGATFSANQQSVITTSGYSDICVFASAYTSGTAIITFATSSVPPGGSSGTGAAAGQVQGTAASGSAAVGNPVLGGGINGTNVKTILTDATGNQLVNTGAVNTTPSQQETQSQVQVSNFGGNNGTAGTLGVETFGVDPCAASGVPKIHAFATITTATTTALVAVSGATVVFVCEVDFGITGTTTAGTILFEQGTGVACATSPVSLTATYTDAGSSISDIFFGIGHGSATAFKTAASNGLCAVTTVGTAPSIPVDVTYVQQ